MILHKHPLIQYSKLSYENVSPYHKGKGRKCRVWYLEYQHNHFWGDLLRDIIIVLTFTGRRVFYWLKKEYRKEFLFGFILLFALIPAPKRVQAQTVSVSVPAYLKPIPKLTGVASEAFSVPDEVQPILPPPAPVAAPASYGDPKAYALSQVGSTQFSCLNSLWIKESEWRVNANNPSGAYGIPQSLPASKMAAFGADYLTNPITQVKWGLSYISSSYGTPCSAWTHSQAYNWY